jgi:DNA-binding protein Fis
MNPDNYTLRTLDEIVGSIEASAILERLKIFNGNQMRAAESLGIERVTLRRKCIQYNIPTPRELAAQKPKRSK